MSVKKALDILEPFESTLEREINDLKKRSKVFEISDDDPRIVVESKIEEKNISKKLSSKLHYLRL